MKKIFAVTAAFAVCLTVTSCGVNNSLPEDTSATEQYIEQASETAQTEVTTTVTNKETTTVTTEKTTVTPAEETTVTEQKYSAEEECLIKFLDYLQNGSDEAWWTINKYDFMDDFKIDSYSYVHRGDEVYDVKLTCSESTCELFPNGDSYWVYDWKFDMRFIPKEKEESFLTRSSLRYEGEEPFRTAYLAAVDFTLHTDVFEADEKWLENYTDIDVHGFYHAYNPYVVINDYAEKKFYDVTPEEFAAAVKKLYNINMTAEQAYLMADESGFMIKGCGHGGAWHYDMLAGYEETDTEIKVRVDYCGDNIYFYPVIESEYTFSKNADGSITLQNVEKIFDRGYDPEWDSV